MLGPPPFKVPQTSFVACALAITNAAKDKVFLVEEMIEGSYLKYIHNSIAQPSNEVDGDPDAKETAIFLCFVQHAQYELTGGLAFVTDYQGELYRATDCNIDTL